MFDTIHAVLDITMNATTSPPVKMGDEEFTSWSEIQEEDEFEDEDDVELV